MKNRAFTLIELLIVVAIIAILAAIAVPNFLEAQVRSKVSRVRADMRSIATAVESYAVDNNKYPIYLNSHDAEYPNYDYTTPGALQDGCYERNLPYLITTPIAYMTGLLVDPFPNMHGDDDGAERVAHTYHYSNDQNNQSMPSTPPGLTQFPVRALYTQLALSNNNPPNWYANGSAIWTIVSHGPDLTHNNYFDGVDPRTYDPTNGTISSGDLYIFGPGLGSR
ncbi:hypothetical protein CVU37_02270 [candidate division BRC1 bacterium HGW-BRC1-1]|jgi:prepilin-type N-terminal cleavage/methylation domain-containing protein|nr:MAG: hypothetical protein CVU37_02270 [candidate division BRC1 bacterium HGW-BRC1-1]